VRQSAIGSYTAALYSEGRVDLERAGMVIQTVTIADWRSGTWHSLRLSAVGDVLRVMVDGVEIIALRDDEPLPPGLVAVAARFSTLEEMMWVDDISLWKPSSEMSGPTLTVTPPS